MDLYHQWQDHNLRKRPYVGAIASQLAAEIYGGEVVDREIADSPLNETRFVFISKAKVTERTGHDKTTVIFGVPPNRAGGLKKALECFYSPEESIEINITWLQPRTMKSQLGFYFFFLTCEGHRNDPQVDYALALLEEESLYLKDLGSYPAEDSQILQEPDFEIPEIEDPLHEPF
jgi:prephenate dehydratase